ncbi:MAG: PaaI family thioesterase [Bradymonadia bacterium]
MSELDPESADFAAQVDALAGGWVRAMGLRYTRATRDAVDAELTVDASHLQPYGLVHGGVYCSIVESIASVGAAMDSMRRGQWVVGVENHTRFLKGVRSGRLIGRGRPETIGEREISWVVNIHDADEQLVATGRMVARVLPKGTRIGGVEVGVPGVLPGAPRVDSPTEGE